jgi:hypothetical protein
VQLGIRRRTVRPKFQNMSAEKEHGRAEGRSAAVQNHNLTDIGAALSAGLFALGLLDGLFRLFTVATSSAAEGIAER